MEKTLHRDLYIEDDWFRKERENIFFGEWTCIGRQEDWPQPGDYQAVSIAGESLLVIRGDDGELRAFFNVCRHRGCQLVDSADASAAKGRMRSNIRCPYHSWTYRFDGSLFHTPHLEVEKEKYHLHKVALDAWGGFVFVNVAGGDKSLAKQLGPIPGRVSRYPLAGLQTAGVIQYEVNANWKVILENYNECYHCAGVHPELCKIVPEFRKNGGAGLDWERGIPQKEGTDTFTFSGTTNRPSFPDLNEAEKTRHFGELVYPNLMVSLSRDHVAAFIVWPEASEKTRIECRFLFHPDAVAMTDFDPADAADFWDIVNRQDWSICERVQRGMHSRPFDAGYYAPMEDMSLDIRQYVSSRLGITVE